MFWKKGNSKKDIFEKQISAINVWTTIMGLTFLLVFGGIGYLQFKSAGELSDTLKEMKKDMKDYTEAYEKALSQNLNRIDNLESRIQSQVNREVDDMREKFKETIGDAPEPAEVELMIDGNVVKSTPYLIKTGQAPENYRQLYFPALSLKNIGGKQADRRNNNLLYNTLCHLGSLLLFRRLSKSYLGPD